MTSTCILNEIFVWTQVVNKLLLLFLSISGHFGRVYAGVLRSSEPEGNPTLVAIKTLKGDQLASRTKMAARLLGRRQLVDYFLQTKHLNVNRASNEYNFMTPLYLLRNEDICIYVDWIGLVICMTILFWNETTEANCVPGHRARFPIAQQNIYTALNPTLITLNKL